MLGGGAKRGKIISIGTGAAGTVAGFGICHLGHYLLDTPIILPIGVEVAEVPFFARSSSFRFMDYIFSSRHEYTFTKIKPKDMQLTRFDDPGTFIGPTIPPSIFENVIFCDTFYILTSISFILIFVIFLIKH